MKDIEELKKTVDTLRELGRDWKENMSLMNDATKGNRDMLESIKRLCRNSNQGDLIRIGLTLVAFPLPIVIDDVLGWSLVAAGLIQKKMRKSSLYLEDVDKTFPYLIRELMDKKQSII